MTHIIMLKIKLGLFYILIYHLRRIISEAESRKENKNCNMKRLCHSCGIVIGLSKRRREAELTTITCRNFGEGIGTATGFYNNISVSCERFLTEYFGVSFASTISPLLNAYIVVFRH
jgi:hypothetical protein